MALATITPLFRASAAARALLATCDGELATAAVAIDPADRYIAAHLAAVRAASAYVDLLGVPRRGKHSIWEQLVAIDSCWVPWAAFFSTGTKLRQAVEMGIPVATSVADEMTAYAEDFRDEIAMAIDPACEWPGVPQASGGQPQSASRRWSGAGQQLKFPSAAVATTRGSLAESKAAPALCLVGAA